MKTKIFCPKCGQVITPDFGGGEVRKRTLIGVAFCPKCGLRTFAKTGTVEGEIRVGWDSFIVKEEK